MTVYPLSQGEISGAHDHPVETLFNDPSSIATAKASTTSRGGQAAVLKAHTAENYTTLLEALFLIHRLPAWGTTLRARAAAMPKLHAVDSGLAARLLRLTPDKLNRREPTTLQQFGHLLETFVVGEALKQLSWMDGITAVGHW